MASLLRTLRCRVESRRSTDRHCGDLCGVESLDEIIEGLAIGQDWQGDVRVVLFVRIKPSVVLDEPLKKKIRDTNSSSYDSAPRSGEDHRGAGYSPDPVRQADRTGRAQRGAGLPVKNIDALANPNALEHFRNLDELAR